MIPLGNPRVQRFLLWNRWTRRVLLALAYGMSEKRVLEKWPVAGYMVLAMRRKSSVKP